MAWGYLVRSCLFGDCGRTLMVLRGRMRWVPSQIDVLPKPGGAKYMGYEVEL